MPFANATYKQNTLTLAFLFLSVLCGTVVVKK